MAAGNTAVCDLPVDRDYKTLMPQFTAKAADGVTPLTQSLQIVGMYRLVAAGTVVLQYNPKELRQIKPGINGATYNTGATDPLSG